MSFRDFRFCRVGATLVLAALLANGCSVLPKPHADPTRFYVLSTSGAPVAAANGAGSATTLQLRPVELANYLRGRALIIRRGENEVQFREYAHWGEALDLGIARVLREELLARGVAGTVVAAGARATGSGADTALTVRVLACEGSAEGAVLFRAVWELTKSESGESIARGDYRATGLFWDGKNEATLAARLSEGVAGLANEIAGAIRK